MLFVQAPLTRQELKTIANERFGDLVKAVVDIEQGTMVVGGELHADAEEFLLEQGSNQRNLWGINLYPDKFGEDFIEFDSVINLRPAHGNRSRGIDNPEICKQIKDLVNSWVKS